MSTPVSSPPRNAQLGTIGERGRLTVPAPVRRKYGLKAGDLVQFTETKDGILIAPKVVIAQHLFDQLEQALGGVSLDEWIASGRDLRANLLAEHYGITKKPTKTN